MTEGSRALGVTFPPMETRREVVVEAATEAEALGYDAFFVAEAWGLDAPVVLAEIATKTDRILLGSAVVNVWSRSAASLAMSAATLFEMTGGRFVLGLGASTPQLIEGLHDVAFSSPLRQLRRVVTQIRQLLRGSRIPLEEGNQARPLRLGVGPASVPIYLATLAPASIRLTGEIADGWMPFFFPLSRLHDGVKLLEEGRSQARASEDACRLCPILGAAVAEEDGSARERAAWWVSFYLTTMGPLYARTLKTLGYGSEVSAVLAANPDRQAGWYRRRPRCSSKNSSCLGRPVQPGSVSPGGTPPVHRSRSFRCPRIGHGKRSNSPSVPLHQRHRAVIPSLRWDGTASAADRPLSVSLGLQLVQLGVEAAVGDEFGVGAGIDDPAAVDDGRRRISWRRPAPSRCSCAAEPTHQP